ncbi:hypothetical protein GPECTOR_12g548 [Gonium pectorale]|uniref:Uncharacterized protein n=1 Tax=Gonium pectorale TaxID=33097 RepID=A0A150GP70_GONPE|nr:hypothetical protein GPECTOR_12g548 [Gonium pectorale]|eukprot:KXZ51585.1 hypothetical protein GPECTOR_12g548 [Gonium pectorale]
MGRGAGSGGGGWAANRTAALAAAALRCTSDDGRPVPVWVGSQLMEALGGPAGGAAANLTLRPRPGDDEWGLSFGQLASLTLTNSLVADVPLSRRGPLVHCGGCRTFKMAMSALVNLTGAAEADPDPEPEKKGAAAGGDGSGSGDGGGAAGATAPDRVFGAVAVYGIQAGGGAGRGGGAELTAVRCANVTGSHGWACFLFVYDAAYGGGGGGDGGAAAAVTALSMSACELFANSVVGGWLYGTYRQPPTMARIGGREVPYDDGGGSGDLPAATGDGYGALLVMYGTGGAGGGAADPPPPLLGVAVVDSHMSGNAGGRGAALAVLGAQVDGGALLSSQLSFVDCLLQANAASGGAGGALAVEIFPTLPSPPSPPPPPLATDPHDLFGPGSGGGSGSGGNDGAGGDGGAGSGGGRRLQAAASRPAPPPPPKPAPRRQRLPYILSLRNVAISTNAAATAGGAIFVAADRALVRLDVQVNASTLESNVARGTAASHGGNGSGSGAGVDRRLLSCGGDGGGGLYVAAASVDAGGAAAAAGDAEECAVDVSDVWAIDNAAADGDGDGASCGGGAVLLAGCLGRIRRSSFLGNSPGGGGGGDLVAGGDVAVHGGATLEAQGAR